MTVDGGVDVARVIPQADTPRVEVAQTRDPQTVATAAASAASTPEDTVVVSAPAVEATRKEAQAVASDKIHDGLTAYVSADTGTEQAQGDAPGPQTTEFQPGPLPEQAPPGFDKERLF